MSLLTRYLLRQLAAPFAFALVALTGFMLLNQVAKKFGQLVGKGLEWSVIAEVFVLSIPFIVAMTLPMAVLVAVLYAVSHLAADNEITAMRASGISIWRILRPMLVWGAAMALVNFLFVDQVLPRSNARLRTLLIEIGRKKPTFELREQVINEVPPSEYALRAGRIDPGTGRLRDIAIYDVGSPTTRRIIYADSGLMAYAPNGEDLTLRLWDGTVHEVRPGRPAPAGAGSAGGDAAGEAEQFELTYFRENQVRVRDVFDQFERSTGESIRGDREMSTCEMLEVVHGARREADQVRADRRRLALRDVRLLLRLPADTAAATPAPRPGGGNARADAAEGDAAAPARPAPGYCAWSTRLAGWLTPRTAQAQQPAQAPEAAEAAEAAEPAILTSWGEVSAMLDRIRDATRRADRYAVEVHKKWAISAACLSFVLVGAVLALRFPRAGMGLVLGGGMAVFSIFYVGLTAGESLADRGLLSPAVAMWWPNAVLAGLGLLGLALVNREMGSTRGGDFQEIRESIVARFRRRRP